MINSGKIFITKLERGFFGAFRIIKIGKIDDCNDDFDTESFLIAITKYIDIRKPDFSETRLTEILYENRFSYRNIPNINIYIDLDGVINNYFEYLGNIPLTKYEKRLQLKVGNGTNGGFPLAGPVRKNLGYNAFLEWRWENEHDEMLREYEEQKEKFQELQKNRKIVPKAMMQDELFWKIIGMFDWNLNNEDEIILPAIKFLSKQKVSDIKQFEESLTYKLYCIDTKKHAMNIGKDSYKEKEDYFSVDLFLYARCATVAKGHEFYEIAVNNPIRMPKDEEFETLLSLSSKAYESKTNKEFEYTAGCDYETYANKDGWK